MKKAGFGVWTVLILALAFVWGMWPYVALRLLPGDRQALDIGKLGQLGDAFGSFNALLTLLAFGGLLYNIILQREQLTLAKQELRENQAKEYESMKERELFFMLQNLTERVRTISIPQPNGHPPIDGFNAIIHVHSRIKDAHRAATGSNWDYSDERFLGHQKHQTANYDALFHGFISGQLAIIEIIKSVSNLDLQSRLISLYLYSTTATERQVLACLASLYLKSDTIAVAKTLGAFRDITWVGLEFYLLRINAAPSN